MSYVSVKTYAHLTDLSERTIRRYIATEAVNFFEDSAKNRIMIAMSEVKKNTVIPLNPEALEQVKKADGGDAAAQTDLAVLFLEQTKASMAIYWLNLSAKQQNSDAMQLLGDCYAKGNGVTKDANRAIMWISKAASLGHILALNQMQNLLPK